MRAGAASCAIGRRLWPITTLHITSYANHARIVVIARAIGTPNLPGGRVSVWSARHLSFIVATRCDLTCAVVRSGLNHPLRIKTMTIYSTTGLHHSIADMVLNDPLFQKRPNNLLSIGADSKTVKGEKIGYLTGILYGSSANTCSPEWTTCPLARTAQCDADCLVTAGRGRMPNVHKARVRKTLEFKQYQQDFMITLVRNISSLRRKADRRGLTPAVRLCGTWDIQFEKVYFEYQGKTVTIFDVFPSQQFYDYTKIPGRIVPDNYHLTFSYSGADKFQKVIEKQLARQPKTNIAVVFQGSQPKTFLGRKLISGDDSDVRFLDDHFSIVALTAKGLAKNSTSPFIVRSK